MPIWPIVLIVVVAMSYYETFYVDGGFLPWWLYFGIIGACVWLLATYPRIGRRKS